MLEATTSKVPIDRERALVIGAAMALRRVHPDKIAKIRRCIAMQPKDGANPAHDRARQPQLRISISL
jgi:hypothetical protein